jgi:hypothetical protein
MLCGRLVGWSRAAWSTLCAWLAARPQAACEVEIQGCGMVREMHEEGRGQTRTWFCAILTAVCCPIQTSVALGWTSARRCCCLALAGSREEAGAVGFRAESALRVDVHEVVVVEQGHCRYRRGTVWEKEGGRWRAPQLGFSFNLRWEAVGRGRCISQKGSGAEAVCLEWNRTVQLLQSSMNCSSPASLNLVSLIVRLHEIHDSR